jgi:hypothetical protein
VGREEDDVDVDQGEAERVVVTGELHISVSCAFLKILIWV